MSEGPRRRGSDAPHMHGAFGSDAFGMRAEQFARFFGTPQFLIGQSVLVVIWVALNVVGARLKWDPYPFILLNLAFSLQAAYAAPLILLAQTRQADRDKVMGEEDAAHREAQTRLAAERQEVALKETGQLRSLLEANTRLTEQVEKLTRELHEHLVGRGLAGT